MSARTDWKPAPAGRRILGVKREASQLLTADQLAERWQVPKAQVYRLARAKKIPFVPLGKYRRFSLTAIAEFEANGGTTGDTKT